MVKIYTRSGDRGETGLFGGMRVRKTSLRIEAYGAVDELNALLGVIAAQFEDREMAGMIEKIQNELHTVCADLANADPQSAGPRVRAEHVQALEECCDELDAELPPLKKFILPGGAPVGALLHYARAVARRVERRVIALAEAEAINSQVVKYLNRLSDLLFLMARAVNHRAGVAETHPDYPTGSS